MGAVHVIEAIMFWTSFLETASGALFGTLGGAGIIYFFQVRREDSQNRHGQFVAGANADFSLGVYVSVLKGFYDRILHERVNDPNRHLTVRPSLPPSVEPPIQLGSLGFAIENGNPLLAARLAQVVERFSHIREAVLRRNELHEEFQRTAAELPAGLRLARPESLIEAMPFQTRGLYDLTEILYKAVPEARDLAKCVRSELRDFSSPTSPAK